MGVFTDRTIDGGAMKRTILWVAVVLVCGIAGAEGIQRGVDFLPTSNAVDGRADISPAFHPGSLPLGGWEQALPQPLLEEFIIDSSTFYVGARYDQRNPSIAFDGTNYLVVWQDNRIVYFGPGLGVYDIFGARVSPSGDVLDPVGIPICTADTNKVSPSVTFDGANYIVVWEDCRRGIEPDIYGARVDVFGTVLDPSGIEIMAAGGSQTDPCIASDGTNSLVLWADSRGMVNPDVWGARVGQDGSVIDPLGFPVTADTFYQGYPSVAFDGTSYLAVWQDYRGTDGDVYGVRLSQSMIPLDTAIAVCTAPSDQYRPSIAFGGPDYFVAWCDRSDCRVYGTRVDTSGLVLDPSGIAVCTTGTVPLYSGPSLVFNGQDYLVTWMDSYEGVFAGRVTTSGIPVDPSGLWISQDSSFEPCVASDGINSLVAWQDGRFADTADVCGARVSQSGAVLDSSGILISTAANQQVLPSVAYGSGDYFTVWSDDRNGGQFDVYGARVDPSGAMLDPSGIMICGAPGNQDQPAVAFGERNHLAVWRDGRNDSDLQIYGTRVNQSGTVLDSSFVISHGAHRTDYPAVTFGRDNYLVVWMDNRNGWPRSIWGARVDASGSVLDTSGITISAVEGSHRYPAVASDGSDYFVVWSDSRGSDRDIYGARVTGSGAVLDTSGIAISAILNAQTNPSVAFDGTNYFVVWQDSRFVPYSDIYGARVDTSGVVLDPYPSEILISDSDGDQKNPVVCFDGTSYFVVWEDARNGDGWDIYGARVDTSGVVLDTSGLELIHQPPGRTHSYELAVPRLVLASGPGSQFLLVYDGFLLEPYSSSRVFGAFYPDVGVTEARRPNALNARLLQNRPNPFQSTTAVRFQVPGPTHVSLKVYDVSGRTVGTLVDGTRTAGLHEVVWDGRDDGGRNLATGVYFYRLQVGEYSETRKMLLVR